MISTGTLRFSRNHRLLLDQLRQFPEAAHDDGPDALEMAVSLVKSSRGPTVEHVKAVFGIFKRARAESMFGGPNDHFGFPRRL